MPVDEQIGVAEPRDVQPRPGDRVAAEREVLAQQQLGPTRRTRTCDPAALELVRLEERGLEGRRGPAPRGDLAVVVPHPDVPVVLGSGRKCRPGVADVERLPGVHRTGVPHQILATRQAGPVLRDTDLVLALGDPARRGGDDPAQQRTSGVDAEWVGHVLGGQRADERWRGLRRTRCWRGYGHDEPAEQYRYASKCQSRPSDDGTSTRPKQSHRGPPGRSAAESFQTIAGPACHAQQTRQRCPNAATCALNAANPAVEGWFLIDSRICAKLGRCPRGWKSSSCCARQPCG